MPFFKKKKEEPKTDEKEKKDSTKSEKEQEKPAEEEESEEEESGSEYESTDEEEDETEATEPAVKKDPKKATETKKEEPKKVEKKPGATEDESDEEDEDEESGEEESDDDEESGPDETEKTETETQVEEETTAAEDVTQTNTAALDTLMDTMTQAEDLPSDQSEQEEWFEAIDDYEGEETDDLSIAIGDKLLIIHKQDDGWWEAENERGDRGLVPSTYLKQIERSESPPSPTKSGKVLWGSVKKALVKTSTTDVLHMMGAVPTGFRKEYLKPKMETYPTSSLLLPKLSPSNLFFKDLLYSPALGKIKPRQSAWCRMIQLQEFRNIPLPGKGTKVLKRFIRIALFNGTEICSNVIKLQAMCTDKEGKIWNFEQKESEQLQSSKLGLIFVRTEQKSADIGVLFELGVLFQRENSGNETEMICGWSHLPLYEQAGNPTPNKAFELPVNGGTPEDKGVPLDADIGTDEQSNIFKSLIMRNRSPNFSVRVTQPTKEQKDLLDCLPDTMVGSAAHINAFSYYRQVLGDQLLRDRMDMMSTDLISDPFLARFPSSANDPFLMDLLRNAWIEAQKKLSRQQKKDPVTLKNRFIKCFMDKVYPRLCLTQDSLDKERKTDGNPLRTPRYLDPLSMLLSAEAEYTPFNTNEIAFNIVNPHCTKAW